MRFNSMGGAATAGALAAALAMFAAGAASAGTIIYDFGAANVDLGPSHTYTDVGSGLSIIASGYDNLGAATDLYGKNLGGNEIGLGLANDPTGNHEIHFQSGFVQLDVKALIGHVSAPATVFATNSTTNGEQWGVFGSNTDGVHGATPLTSGTVETSSPLPDWGAYRYYDFVELNHTPGQGDNFLIHDLTTASVPEPASWAMLLVGFFGLGAMARRSRTLASAV